MMKYVYESPDGGDTIYRRRPGQTQRELYKVSERRQQQDIAQARWLIWENIIAAGDSNPALQDALDRARVIYELSKK